MLRPLSQAASLSTFCPIPAQGSGINFMCLLASYTSERRDRTLSEPKCQTTFAMSPQVGSVTFLPSPKGVSGWEALKFTVLCKILKKRKEEEDSEPAFFTASDTTFISGLCLSKALGATQRSRPETYSAGDGREGALH